jgi:hypothetical protein
VVDYDSDPHCHEHFDWLSFLEALGLVVRFNELPRKLDIQLGGVNSGSLVDLYAQLEATGQVDFWNAYLATHPPQAHEEPFSERLDAFMGLLFHLWARLPRRDKTRKRA